MAVTGKAGKTTQNHVESALFLLWFFLWYKRARYLFCTINCLSAVRYEDLCFSIELTEISHGFCQSLVS